MYTNPNPPFDNKEWIEKISDDGVFQENIEKWIADSKVGILTKEDVINVATKIAEHRKDPAILEDVQKRLG